MATSARTMGESELLAALLSATGDLHPARGTTQAELDDLRRAYLSHLSGGQAKAPAPAPPAATAGATAAGLTRELRYLVERHLESAQAADALRLVRRDSPVRWESAAIAPDRSFGPFVERDALPVWFDLFRRTRYLRVRRSATGPDFLLLPIGTSTTPVTLGPTRRLSLPGGTVWIAARQFSPLAPPSAYTGLRIRGGNLAFGAMDSAHDGILVVRPEEALRLELLLDPPVAAGNPVGPGAQAANTTVTWPQSVVFFLDPGGTRVEWSSAARLGAYGSDFDLTLDHPHTRYDSELRHVQVPLTAAPAELPVQAVESSLFEPSGTAAVRGAAWSLPIAISAPEELGDAAGIGYLLLSAGAGLQARWKGIDSPVPMTATRILADGASLLVMGDSLESAASQSFELWRESAQRRCTVSLSFRRKSKIGFLSLRSGVDAVLVSGAASANLDRPLDAASERVGDPVQVNCTLLEKPGVLDLHLTSVRETPGSERTLAFALENALLTTSRLRDLALHGSLAPDGGLDAGTLTLGFGVFQLLPTLPDPYAASFSSRPRRDVANADTRLQAMVTWRTPESATLSFDVRGATEFLDGVIPDPVPAPLTNRFAESFQRWQENSRTGGLLLLDLSSNADQFGVDLALNDRVHPALAIRDMALSTAALNVRSFLLPQFHWEPVTTRPNPRNITEPQHPFLLRFAHDGPAARVATNSVQLVPVAPVPVAMAIDRAYHSGDRATALFTLPFGIEAIALLDRTERLYVTPPDLRVQQASFDGLRGARQITLQAGVQAPGLERVGYFLKELVQRLPGAAHQRPNNVIQVPLTPDPPVPGELPVRSVLGNTIGNFFDNRFTEEVPIRRIDLSGHGASIFSRWFSQSGKPVDVAQVAFDANHGRTAYERVQVKSILWPCCAVLVRSMTLERYGSGTVIRWDSAWLAMTPGLFVAPPLSDVTIHPGVVRGMHDIREIRDTDHRIVLASGKPVQAVYFDADVAVEGCLRGQGSNGRVPARRQLGYVQEIALGDSDGTDPLSAADLAELLAREGEVGGPFDCGIRLGSSPQQMNLTGAFTEIAPQPGGGIPNFAVVARGSLVLPAAAQCSVVRVPLTDGIAEPVDASRGIPLVRTGTATSGSIDQPLRIADGVDLLAGPVTDYALMFSGSSQRILYPRPKVDAGAVHITSAVKPRLADPYLMLRAGGLFPRLSDAIEFADATPLSVASGALKFVPEVVKFPVAGIAAREIVSAGDWASKITYAGHDGSATQVAIDTARDWKIDLGGMSQGLDLGPAKDLLKLVHDVHSPMDALDNFPQPQVVLAPALDAAKDILTILGEIAKPAGAGLPAPLSVDVNFSGTTFRLSAHVGFRLEGEDGQPIECGFGKIRGELQIGANLTAELLTARTGGDVHLEITGSYQQLVFPLIYGGGQLRFRIAANQDGSTSVEFDACTMGSVGGEVIPKLIELEATVKYGYYLQHEGGDFRPGIILGMDGRAKLLAGFLGFGFGAEGRLVITRLATALDGDGPSVTLRGDVLVAGTVTLAWAIKERKSFHVAYEQNLNWKMVAAAAAGYLLIP